MGLSVHHPSVSTLHAIQAQSLSIRVVSDTHAPLQGALVEVWAKGIRIGSGITAATGLVHFSMPITPTAVLRVSHLEFESVYYKRASVPAVIVMARSAVPISRIEVSPVSPCSVGPATQAAALWESIRHKYRPVLPTLALAFGSLRELSTVPDSLLGRSASVAEPFTRMRGPGLGTNAQYALQVDGLPKSSEYENWDYLRLGSLDADHIITDEFALTHRFGFVNHEQLVISLCPKNQKAKPSISGVIVLGRDSTIEAMRWSYHVPKNDERAAGEVVFFRTDDTWLRPQRSVFWRRGRLPGTVLQQIETFDFWALGASVEVNEAVQTYQRAALANYISGRKRQ